MKYDFDTLFPSRGECKYVWDALAARGIDAPDAINYGVAEMKFPPAPEMIEALHRCVDDGYFGYTQDSGYSQVVCDFIRARHGWRPEPDWVTQTYGVVSAISMAIRAFTEKGDGVIIQTPVYNPFFQEIKRNGRVVRDNALVRGAAGYTMDFEDFEKKAAEPGTKLFVLCSPHNPVGRVWTREELSRIDDICRANGVIVISDEIHSDLAFGRKHTIYSAVSQFSEQNCVVCTAPSKAFNIPGLTTSNIIIPNDELRDKFRQEADLSMGEFLNPTGIAAGTAAYTKCLNWLDELNEYVKANFAYLHKLLSRRLPDAWMACSEGTYLAWVDMSFLGISDSELEELFFKNAGLSVNMGTRYGGDSSGFVRINIGCPREYIEIFVDKLCMAIDGLNK